MFAGKGIPVIGGGLSCIYTILYNGCLFFTSIVFLAGVLNQRMCLSEKEGW